MLEDDDEGLSVEVTGTVVHEVVVVVLDGDDSGVATTVTGTGCEVVVVVLVDSLLSTGAEEVVTVVVEDDGGLSVTVSGTVVHEVVVLAVDGDDSGAAATVVITGTDCEVVVVLVLVSGAHSASVLSAGAADVVTTVLDELGAAVTVTGTDCVTVVVVLDGDGDEDWLSPLLTVVVLVSGAHSPSTL